MSVASSQIWRAPRSNVFRGIKEAETVGLVLLEKANPDENPLEFNNIITQNKLVLFYNDDDPWSYMLKSVMSNIGITEIHLVDVSGLDMYSLNLKKSWLFTAARNGRLTYTLRVSASAKSMIL